MWKPLLPLVFLISTLTFLGCLGVVIYGDNPYLSNKKNVHLATVETIAEHYHREIRALENKVTASVQEESIREFFLSAGRNLRAESTIGFADPFLINLLVIDERDQITYAYAPLNIPLRAAPVRNGVALIDQETIIITTPIEEAPNGERVVFVYNLRLLIKNIFTTSINSFEESNFKSYRYAYIYALSPETTHNSQIGRIETLIDKGYEENDTVIYTTSVVGGDKLIGRQMSTGFFLGIFYQNVSGNIPLLSWVLLMACGLSFFITGSQLIFSLQSARPHWTMMETRRFFSWRRRSDSSKSTKSPPPSALKRKDVLTSEHSTMPTDDKDEDDSLDEKEMPSHSQIKRVTHAHYPEIPSLIASLQGTNPEVSRKKDNRDSIDLSEDPESVPPSFSHRSVIRAIKPHARKLVTTEENRIPIIEQITKYPWAMILILDELKPQMGFTLNEFKGIDFQTAESLIIHEDDPLFTRFLTKDKAFFIRDAHKNFLPQRIAPAQMHHLQNVRSLLILPLKSAKNRRVKTILILG